MKKKNWFLGLFIISILALSFFWGEPLFESPPEQSRAAEASDQLNSGQANEEAQPISEQVEQETLVIPEGEQEMAEIPLDDRVRTGGDADAETGSIFPVKPEENMAAPPVDTEPEPLPSDAPHEKDQYLTDPVPEGKPKPVEWQGVEINAEKQLTASLSVSCETILDNLDKFDSSKLEVLPEDGIIYPAQTVIFYEGESVFDVLLREMRANKIHMEFVMTPIYNSNYVEGINNLYEFDTGELSGWMYKVNGWFPNYGSSRYLVQEGDLIEWVYTCDLGRDVGGSMAVGGGPE